MAQHPEGRALKVQALYFPSLPSRAPLLKPHNRYQECSHLAYGYCYIENYCINNFVISQFHVSFSVEISYLVNHSYSNSKYHSKYENPRSSTPNESSPTQKACRHFNTLYKTLDPPWDDGSISHTESCPHQPNFAKPSRWTGISSFLLLMLLRIRCRRKGGVGQGFVGRGAPGDFNTPKLR